LVKFLSYIKEEILLGCGDQLFEPAIADGDDPMEKSADVPKDLD